MGWLDREREQIGVVLPNLDDELRALPFLSLESPGGPGIELFRKLGGPGLVIPVDIGGRGATPLEAARVQRAIGARTPSLAVATTMHHFSVATLVELSTSGVESIMLEAIAAENLLVASGFAEGRPGQGVLTATMTGRPTATGIVITGRKRPCSLSRSMDLLTVSVSVEDQLAVALVPRGLPGITCRDLWSSPVLAGAETGEVTLDEVAIPRRLLSYVGDPTTLDASQIGAFGWFEVLITASYIGAVSGMVDIALEAERDLGDGVITAASLLEEAMAGVESLAVELAAGERTERLLARTLFARYAIQEQLLTAAGWVAEALGGNAFASNEEIALRLATAPGLSFHPPARSMMLDPLRQYLKGARLQIDPLVRSSH